MLWRHVEYYYTMHQTYNRTRDGFHKLIMLWRHVEYYSLDLTEHDKMYHKWKFCYTFILSF